ncbi:MAG: flagellar basal body rod protein FlgB [Hyphomonadaceae bacterium]|nr:flagellar basal body rod protein FlgB [Hyphomonadaceae bacterium]
MDIANSSFFGMLRARLDQLSERQRLISENIANASTPNYRPRDLDTSAFERAMANQSRSGLAMTRTSPAHMSSGGGRIDPQIITRDDSETTIDGNAVVLEDEMARATETRMQYETSIALYQKGLQLVRMAAKPPGR